MAEAAGGRSLAQPSACAPSSVYLRPSGAQVLPRTISRRPSARAPSISPARRRWTASRPCRRAGCKGLARLRSATGLAGGASARASFRCLGARARHGASVCAGRAAKPSPACACKAARAERDPHREMDRQPLRDLRQGHSGPRAAEAARLRARRRVARQHHPQRAAPIRGRSPATRFPPTSKAS